jgi:hypothetical protein
LGLAVSASPKNVAIPVAKGVAKAAGKAVPHRLTPEGMYQSSLRPGLSKRNIPKIEKEVKTGLREAVPVSRKGLAKTDATIDAINDEISGKIAGKSEQLGPVIDPADVAARVEQKRPTFADQVNPDADLAALGKSKAQFLDKHTEKIPYTKVEPSLEGSGYADLGQGVIKQKKPLTLSEAQAEKQGTYRQLKDKAYGELKSADIEAQKALARGLKEEIARRVPELDALNAREGALIELQTELERMVAREGNKNILGLVPATMAHNPYGFLATLLMDNPWVKSRVAIALDRARKVRPSATSVGQVAPASLLGANKDAPPRFAHGGIAGLNGPEKIIVGDGGEPELILPLSHIRMMGPQAQKHLLKGIGSHLGIGKPRRNTTLGHELGGRSRPQEKK